MFCLKNQTHDHRINLEPKTRPVVVRPYRYAHAEKDEMQGDACLNKES